jgi:nucleotide-binding universal stress UspA family protein
MLALHRSRWKGFAMFKKIIWATDGSEAADHALPYVKELAAPNGSKVIVCHSVLALLGPRAGGVPIAADEDDIEAKIRGQVDALGSEGIDASLRIVGGDTVHGAAHDIVRVADEEGADLIVAATRGHTALGGLLLGSVTQRLLYVANCPVLVVPVRAHAEAAAADTSSERALA